MSRGDALVTALCPTKPHVAVLTRGQGMHRGSFQYDSSAAQSETASKDNVTLGRSIRSNRPGWTYDVEYCGKQKYGHSAI